MKQTNEFIILTVPDIPNLEDISNELGVAPELLQVGFILIVVFITMVFLRYFYTKMSRRSRRSRKPEVVPEIQEANSLTKVNIDFKKGQHAIDYLERLIQEKYNYYMYLELLPIYLDRKIPEKNTIKEVKEKIYVSVVGSLTKAVKEEVLIFFTEKGIEIFVHEKIVVLINQTDFRSAEKFTEAFREVNLSNVDKLV